MTPDPVIDPGPPEFDRSAESINQTIAVWARSFFSNPGLVAALLWVSGAIGVAFLIPLRHWPTDSLARLIIPVVIAVGFAAIRTTVGKSLPAWSLHIDVGIANLLISIVIWTAQSKHINISNLYLLAEIFALLYFPIRAALGHLLSAGAAYAVILLMIPPLPEPKIIAWLSTFGTSAILAVVIAGLVSVLRNAARNDPLTGLANRRSWDEHLAIELERSTRSGEIFSVIVMDLDGFKAVNDSYGHSAGDRVLQTSARVWQNATRNGGDFLARLGGDEFGLIAPNTDEVTARGLARRLKNALPDDISASIGVATWDRTESASDLVRRADIAMYQSKRNHRLGGNSSPA